MRISSTQKNQLRPNHSIVKVRPCRTSKESNSTTIKRRFCPFKFRETSTFTSNYSIPQLWLICLLRLPKIQPIPPSLHCLWPISLSCWFTKCFTSTIKMIILLDCLRDYHYPHLSRKEWVRREDCSGKILW